MLILTFRQGDRITLETVDGIVTLHRGRGDRLAFDIPKTVQVTRLGVAPQRQNPIKDLPAVLRQIVDDVHSSGTVSGSSMAKAEAILEHLK